MSSAAYTELTSGLVILNLYDANIAPLKLRRNAAIQIYYYYYLSVRPFHPRWSQSAALNAQSYRRKQAATSAMRGNNKADRLVNRVGNCADSGEKALKCEQRNSLSVSVVTLRCREDQLASISPSYPPTQQTAPATGIDILNNRTFTSYCKQTCIIHILTLKQSSLQCQHGNNMTRRLSGLQPLKLFISASEQH